MVALPAWPVTGVIALVVVYGAVVAALAVLGRRGDARALAGFAPDCVVLVRRLVADERVPRSRKLLLIGLIGYLAMPIDVIPDVIPVAGQLDDVILAVLVLRSIVKATGPDVIAQHWPGPPRSLAVLLRLAQHEPR